MLELYSTFSIKQKFNCNVAQERRLRELSEIMYSLCLRDFVA